MDAGICVFVMSYMTDSECQREQQRFLSYLWLSHYLAEESKQPNSQKYYFCITQKQGNETFSWHVHLMPIFYLLEHVQEEKPW